MFLVHGWKDGCGVVVGEGETLEEAISQWSGGEDYIADFYRNKPAIFIGQKVALKLTHYVDKME
jgi:hypothetical protein